MLALVSAKTLHLPPFGTTFVPGFQPFAVAILDAVPFFEIAAHRLENRDPCQQQERVNLLIGNLADPASEPEQGFEDFRFKDFIGNRETGNGPRSGARESARVSPEEGFGFRELR